FVQAEDGIRDLIVTGVQTCALPISTSRATTMPGSSFSNTDLPNPLTNLDVSANSFDNNRRGVGLINTDMSTIHDNRMTNSTFVRSEERRVGKNRPLRWRGGVWNHTC